MPVVLHDSQRQDGDHLPDSRCDVLILLLDRPRQRLATQPVRGVPP
jgi:hypothetical protein